MSESNQRTRLFVAVRIENYRLQFLTDDGEWSDPGDATLISSDREMVFQEGRANGGLLMNTDGLPGPSAYRRFQDRIAQMRPAVEQKPTASASNGEKPPATAEETAKAAKDRQRAKREAETGQTEAPY